MKGFLLLLAMFLLTSCDGSSGETCGFHDGTSGPCGPTIAPEEHPPKAPFVGYLCDWTLTWTLPTHRENPNDQIRTPLDPNDIKTFRIYAAHTANSDAPIEFIMDVNPFLLQWTFAGLEQRRWWFTGTVIDTNGRESHKIAAGVNHISNVECIPN